MEYQTYRVIYYERKNISRSINMCTIFLLEEKINLRLGGLLLIVSKMTVHFFKGMKCQIDL